MYYLCWYITVKYALLQFFCFFVWLFIFQSNRKMNPVRAGWQISWRASRPVGLTNKPAEENGWQETADKTASSFIRPREDTQCSGMVSCFPSRTARTTVHVRSVSEFTGAITVQIRSLRRLLRFPLTNLFKLKPSGDIIR